MIKFPKLNPYYPTDQERCEAVLSQFLWAFTGGLDDYMNSAKWQESAESDSKLGDPWSELAEAKGRESEIETEKNLETIPGYRVGEPEVMTMRDFCMEWLPDAIIAVDHLCGCEPECQEWKDCRFLLTKIGLFNDDLLPLREIYERVFEQSVDIRVRIKIRERVIRATETVESAVLRFILDRNSRGEGPTEKQIHEGIGRDGDVKSAIARLRKSGNEIENSGDGGGYWYKK